jgi:hypothetical protein
VPPPKALRCNSISRPQPPCAHPTFRVLTRRNASHRETRSAGWMSQRLQANSLQPSQPTVAGVLFATLQYTMRRSPPPPAHPPFRVLTRRNASHHETRSAGWMSQRLQANSFATQTDEPTVAGAFFATQTHTHTYIRTHCEWRAHSCSPPAWDLEYFCRGGWAQLDTTSLC